MKPQAHFDCNAFRVAALDRAALSEHACAECERWVGRLALREGLLRTLPRMVAPSELEGLSEREFQSEGRRARAVRALESLARVEAGDEFDRAVEALASGTGPQFSARAPSVLERLVAEDLANPVKARVARQFEGLPRLVAPMVLEQRVARELAKPRAERKLATRAWLSVAAAAIALLSLAPQAFERRGAPSDLQSARGARPFRVERLESTRDLSPSARAWFETVSSGLLEQNNI
ncbi:MAG: hypothetical protein FJ294_02275 [Planctomycetes bacterium]|nr:hypothetical protein [Planctomycetota bacterium]